MRREVIAFGTLCNESSKFDIFPHYFLYPYLMIKPAEFISHPVKSHFGSIGDIRIYRMRHVAVNSLHDGRHKLTTKPFALLIDVPIRTTAEIDAFKRTFIRDWQIILHDGKCDLLQRRFAISAHYERLTLLQLMNIFGL